MSLLKTAKGLLVEYAVSLPPLVLVFDVVSPESLTRSRSITLSLGQTPANQGGYDFTLPTETPRVSQGVSAKPETLSVQIRLDCTDKLNEGDSIAELMGIEPQIDTLKTMVEPKAQGPLGMQVLSSIGALGPRAFEQQENASVLLYIWGTHVLPVFMTSVTINHMEHMPNLVPYRAYATLNMQVIEGNNPFYEVEKVRQVASAALNTGQTVTDAITSLF